MKRKLLFLIAVCVFILTVPAEAAVSGDYEYDPNYIDSTCTITNYTGPGGDITIPDTLDTLTVTVIGDYAFAGNYSLTGITVGNSVTSIGEGAFQYSGLTNITIGNNVTTIGYRAFLICADLSNITLGNSVTTIGGYAFYSCSSLTSIVIPESVTTIGEAAFLNCNGLAGNLIIPDSVTNIEARAFSHCINLSCLTIGNGVTTIGDEAFRECSSLMGLYLKGDSPALGSDVFYNVNATVYYFQGTTGWGSTLGGLPTAPWDDQYTWTDNGDTTCTITGYTGPGGDITIPDTLNGLTVTALGHYAFSGSSGLTTVVIPDSVTSIEWYVFRFCYNLTSIIIPNSVTSVGNGAFYDCTGLTSVNIPESVTSLSSVAFYGCSGLIEITVDMLNPTYSSLNGVLFNKAQTELIQYPDAKPGAYTIPDGVTVVENLAFSESNGLTHLAVGIDLTSIGTDSFRGCSNLLDITVDVLNPAYSTLDGVLFDKSQTELLQYPSGKAGFYSIPHGITSIDYNAFTGNSNLTCIMVPDSVITICSGAFSGCASTLSGIYFKGDAPAFIQGTFTNTENVTIYYLPGTMGWGVTYDGVPTAVWSLSIADMDADGDVNLWDFAAFAAAWQAVDEYDPQCDISDPVDGVIDDADLEVFADQWLVTPCQ